MSKDVGRKLKARRNGAKNRHGELTLVASSDRMGRGNASGESGKDEDESRSTHIDDDDKVCCKTSVGWSRCM
jgi:hypothetical protein